MLRVKAIWRLNNTVFNSSDDAIDGIYSSIKSAYETLLFATYAIAIC